MDVYGLRKNSLRRQQQHQPTSDQERQSQPPTLISVALCTVLNSLKSQKYNEKLLSLIRNICTTVPSNNLHLVGYEYPESQIKVSRVHHLNILDILNNATYWIETIVFFMPNLEYGFVTLLHEYW